MQQSSDSIGSLAAALAKAQSGARQSGKVDGCDYSAGRS